MTDTPNRPPLWWAMQDAGSNAPGTPRDAIAAARAALDEQQGEGPSDEELCDLWSWAAAQDHGPWPTQQHCFARAVLARWGRQPTPPAEGEVGELMEWLKANSSGVYRPAARAAELLQQQHPTPVPVSERLPGPDDRNAEGGCWWFCTAYPGDWPHWILGKEAFCDPTHWLPAHALPLPQGEVE